MIKKRVIPSLLWSNNNLVKGVNFNNRRQVADILTSIKIYNSRDVDEIIILDIDATEQKKSPDLEAIADFSKYITVPFTYGGGISNLENALDVLKNGADKICLNSIIYKNFDIIGEIAKHTGSQSIVASIDFKVVDGNYKCVSNSGKKIERYDPVELAEICEKEGCGELLINSIDQEGTMQGYNIDILEKINSKVSLPIIISGGAGNYDHMYQALKKNASAVCAATIFSFTEQTPTEAKKFLKKKKIDVRDGFRYI